MSRNGHIRADLKRSPGAQALPFLLFTILCLRALVRILRSLLGLRAVGQCSRQQEGGGPKAKGARQLNLSPYVRNSVDFSATLPRELLLTSIGQTVLQDHF